MSNSSTAARAFILASLKDIGIAQNKLTSINDGAQMYGPQGLLDSVHLVGLISAIGEQIDRTGGAAESFFDVLDEGLFDNFKDINRIESLLNGKFSHVSFCS
ncbi:hypothetical protein [Pseudomonas sp.]|uniref:hypothetical protein n=1 Tax=Pseudomonas sp. TaxID=306 RepID=UPI0026173CF4|nr:hypothetical protein [Pseudomonas sp.]